MRTHYLLYTGITLPVIFWVSTVIGGFIHGNYNHLSGTISQLGALSSCSHVFMTTCTAICGALSICFVIGVYQACRQMGINIAPVFGMLAVPVMFLWAAAFPLGNPLHAVMGPVILLLYVGILISAFVWRGMALQQFRLISVISLLILLLIFLRFIPAVQNHYPGLVQRFVHFGWSFWFVSVAITFNRLLSTNYTINNLKS
ncbi:DUF998 domain-containing protein [Mucilaginibacter gynuensis]|uniref:DUF998 domain-containing protein n=1 Tax=Mucilaginibacter gynuensis TaxID=1302236 RepID=UPI0031ED8E9A